MRGETSDFAAMRDAFRNAGLCTEALVESWCARRDDASDGEDSLYVPSPQRVKIRRRLAEARSWSGLWRAAACTQMRARGPGDCCGERSFCSACCRPRRRRKSYAPRSPVLPSVLTNASIIFSAKSTQATWRCLLALEERCVLATGSAGRREALAATAAVLSNSKKKRLGTATQTRCCGRSSP